MALVRKSNPKTTSSSQRKTIKVSPYENPENVMRLMADICSAVPSADENVYRKIVVDAYSKKINGVSLKEFLEEKRKVLHNPNFFSNLKECCMDIGQAISGHDNTENTKIVVAGGFSSGKSSFLNELTKNKNLLPFGVEPVSVVKTYLYCSRVNTSVSVKGVNLKDVLVKLDTGVLQAIQHANKSNIYLASVLEKLFVDIPSKELDGIAFIDTPGYNNSDRANRSNGKTDKDTALEGLNEGKVLFWLVDCEKGTTVSDDIEMIRQFKGKKVFIFNKADKKPEKDLVDIVETAARTLYDEFPKEEIIDILAYSTRDSKIHYSKNKMTLMSIIAEAKKTGNGASDINVLKEMVKELFDDEIAESKSRIKSKEEYKDAVDWKNICEKEYRKRRDEITDSIDNLKVNFKSNSGVSSEAVEEMDGLFDDTGEILRTLCLRVESFCNTHSVGSSILINAVKEARRDFYPVQKGKIHIVKNYKSKERDYLFNERHSGYLSGMVNELDCLLDKTVDILQVLCLKVESFCNIPSFSDSLLMNAVSVARMCLYENQKEQKLIVKRNKGTDIGSKFTELFGNIDPDNDTEVRHYKNYYEEACRKCHDILVGNETAESIIKSMTKYKEAFMSALNLGIREYQNKCEAQNLQSDKDETPDVFDCINKEDYNKFLHSFEKEVDMSACNGEGYSPLTLAVQKGNNAMVKFMLDHGASPSAKDRRGYNAFHTAVENQFRDICEMLLDNDPDLISTKTAGGETVEELADKQAFKKWIEKEISKAI